MLGRFIVVLVAALTVVAPARESIAHSPSSSYLAVDLEDRQPASLTLTLALIDLLQVLPLDANADSRLTWGEVGAARADILSCVSGGLRLSIQGIQCALIAGDAEFELEQVAGAPSLKIVMPVACPEVHVRAAARADYRVRCDLFFDIDPSHKTLLQVGGDGADRLFVLSSGRREMLFDTYSSTGRGFVGDGFRHILAGYDHLAFLMLLILPAVGTGHIRTRLIHIGRIVTAFTLAHSATLAGVVTGLVHLPAAPVEIAIAGSVVLAGLMNVWRPFRVAGWKLAIAFGLLHGFGFAGALAEVGLPHQAIPVALLFFNLGVEIGQLAFVGAVLAAGWLFRRAAALRFEPALVQRSINRLDMMAVYAIGTVAAFWLIERTSGFFV
jgi:hypothetical protein